MPTDADRFFQSPQPAARFKHRVVRNQLGAFAGKVGKHAEGHQVAYLDGYAGPGTYADDAKGSPAVAAQVAQDLKDLRHLTGVFIEIRRTFADELTALLAHQGLQHWQVFHGSCQEQLNAALAAVGPKPLLAFLDPFGLGLPFDQLVGDVLGRPTDLGGAWTPTEVILNFSDSALRRLAGFLDKQYDVPPRPLTLLADVQGQDLEERAQIRQERQAANLALLDGFLGGPGWREVARSGAADWPDQVRTAWIAKVQHAAGHSWRALDIPVADRANGPTAFHLVLLTRSDVAAWEFNQGVSRAWARLYEETWQPPPADTLFGPLASEPPSLHPSLEEELLDHLRGVAAIGDDLVAAQDIRGVFGPTLGRARERHLRTALTRLKTEGVLGGEPPTGPLGNYRIVPSRGRGISS